MRNLFVAGNWKMNCGPEETAELLQGIQKSEVNIPPNVDVLVCPPMISLGAASDELDGNEEIALGAQNMCPEDNGAFTGETSTQMLNVVGCSLVILGYSECFQFFVAYDEYVYMIVFVALF